MSKCWDALRALPNNSVVFAHAQDIAALMAESVAKSSILPCDIKLPEDGRPSFRNGYLLYMKEWFNYDPYFAAKLRPILAMLPQTTPSEFSTLTKLFAVRDQLRNHGSLDASCMHLLKNRTLARINGVSLHPDLMKSPIVEISLEERVSTPIQLHWSQNRSLMLQTVVHSIGTQLDQNIPIDSIKIVNGTAEDYATLARLADLCGWQIHNNGPKPLLHYPKALIYLSIFQTQGYRDANSYLEKLHTSDDSIDRTIAETIVNIINVYPVDTFINHPELLTYHLETDTIVLPRMMNVVEWIRFDQVDPTSANHYHLLHYADGMFPDVCRDDDALMDSEKQSIGMDTSIDTNTQTRNETTRILESTKHLSFYFAEFESGTTWRVAELTPHRDIVITGKESVLPTLSFSRDLAKLDYAKRRHEYLTFGTSDSITTYLAKKFEPEVRRYDPQFKPLSSRVKESLLGTRVSLSATSLEHFFHCRFHYMLTYLLKFDQVETTIPLYLGNLAHDYLQKAFEKKEAFQWEKLNKKINPSFFDSRTKEIANQFFQRLEVVADYLLKRTERSQFRDVRFEHKVHYDIAGTPTFVVNGKIDRVMMLSDGGCDYVVVIDYKTGNAKFNHEDFLKGTDLQLVFYLHLLAKEQPDQLFHVAGFYYQPVNLGKYARRKDSDPIQRLLKLEGMSYRNETIHQAFDPEENVKGIRLKADGTFAKSSRLFDDEMIQADLTHIESLIRTAMQAIQMGDFRINPLPPKRNHAISESCEYCDYQGICYLAAKNTDVADDFEDTTGEEE